MNQGKIQQEASVSRGEEVDWCGGAVCRPTYLYYKRVDEAACYGSGFFVTVGSIVVLLVLLLLKQWMMM